MSTQTKPERIPPITDERLAELMAKIKPVVRDNVSQGARKLSYVTPRNPRNESFTWEPQRLGQANDLVEIARMDTYHTWAYYGFFKPTVAEVLAAIQHRPDLEHILAFEVCGPKDVDDLRRQWDIVNEGYHRATTVLYGRKS